jgi:hypothetical protein
MTDLQHKLAALTKICGLARLSRAMTSLCVERMSQGHHEHANDAAEPGFDWRGNAREEMADLICYIAIGLARGEIDKMNLGLLGQALRDLKKVVEL